MSDTPQVRAVLMGLDPDAIQHFRPILKGAEIREITASLESLSSPMDPAPALIVCSPGSSGISPFEMAQLLRMNHPGSIILLIFKDSMGEFDRRGFVKNGASDAFLLPQESELLRETLTDVIAGLGIGAMKLKPVKVIDLSGDVALDFDTYLYFPINDKRIQFSKGGEAMGQSRIDNLKAHNFSTLLVPKSQIDKFYAYSAKTLKALLNGDGISETERQERARESVCELLKGVYQIKGSGGFSEGQELVASCREIVKALVSSQPGGREFIERLGAIMGGQDSSYSHLANVAAYATLFAVGLGMKDVQELAMAALFHDVGLQGLSPRLQEAAEVQLTPEELALYETHPMLSVKIMQEKRFPVSDKVHKIIMQHHECFNGSGFPKKISGSQICMEARILAVADRFDELTVVQTGRALMSPFEAINKLRQEAARDPGRMTLDPVVLNKVVALFPQ